MRLRCNDVKYDFGRPRPYYHVLSTGNKPGHSSLGFPLQRPPHPIPPVLLHDLDVEPLKVVKIATTLDCLKLLSPRRLVPVRNCTVST